LAILIANFSILRLSFFFLSDLESSSLELELELGLELELELELELGISLFFDLWLDLDLLHVFDLIDALSSSSVGGDRGIGGC